MTASGGEAGFTLLELLVVLVVLGFAAALAAPAIRPGGGPAVALRTATADAVAQLVAAREDAIFDRRVHCIGLTGDVAPDCQPLRLRGDVALSAPGATSIRFHRDGSSSGARLTLVAGGLRQRLRVVGATGQIVLR